MRTPRQTKVELQHLGKKYRSDKQLENRESKRRFHTVLQCESLEGRNLLSATAMPEVQIESVTNATPASTGLTVSEVTSLYGFSSVAAFKTSAGSTVAATGAGQTIAIIDSYNDPNIKSDLAAFDAKMALPAANLTVVNQSGGSSLPQTDSGWDLEISLDVEWAHAIAPSANILLVEASSDNLNDLLSAVQYATTVSTVSVVSMSWGSSEFNGETSYDSYFTTPAGHEGITFVGASGDSGSPGIWPAISSNVLAVGGTTLKVSPTASYPGETAWSDSGGGTSLYESEPSWQTAVQSTGKRTSPDVSYDANPNTGFDVYDSVATGGESGWFQVGGTSDAAPQWGALIAIANQGRVADGGATLNGAQAALYSLPSADFHDVTSGSNGGYSAKAGYDEVTGLGTPIATLLIPGLVSYTGSTSGSGSSGSGSSGSGSSGSGSSGGGSSGGGFGHHHGFGGFGGFSGFGGYFGFGGRLDEIGSSMSTAVAEAFASTELALSDAGSQSVVVASSNSLAGIQQTNVLPSGTVSGEAPAASRGQGSDQAPARPIAFASLQGDAAAFNSMSASNVGLNNAMAINSLANATTTSIARQDVDASAATSQIVSHGTSASHQTSSRVAVSRESLGADSVELSPATLQAVWSSLDIDLDDPTTFAAPVGADAPLVENAHVENAFIENAFIDNAATTNSATMAYSSSPLALVMAGVAIGWARTQVEDRLKTPVRQWPGKRSQ